MNPQENNQEIRTLEAVLKKDYLAFAKSKSLLFDTFFTEKLTNNYKQLVTIEPIVFDKKKKLGINYSFSTSYFGNLIIASTSKGICYVAFDNDKVIAIENLKNEFPTANFSEQIDVFQQNALLFFQDNQAKLPRIKLHLKGTEFQIKIWKTLLRILYGKLATYGQIAEQIGKSKASRAVGNAIGSNPVAFIIPCHRVIQSTGKIGGYRWGKNKKTAIIKRELAQTRFIEL